MTLLTPKGLKAASQAEVAAAIATETTRAEGRENTNATAATAASTAAAAASTAAAAAQTTANTAKTDAATAKGEVAALKKKFRTWHEYAVEGTLEVKKLLPFYIPKLAAGEVVELVEVTSILIVGACKVTLEENGVALAEYTNLAITSGFKQNAGVASPLIAKEFLVPNVTAVTGAEGLVLQLVLEHTV